MKLVFQNPNWFLTIISDDRDIPIFVIPPFGQISEAFYKNCVSFPVMSWSNHQPRWSVGHLYPRSEFLFGGRPFLCHQPRSRDVNEKVTTLLVIPDSDFPGFQDNHLISSGCILHELVHRKRDEFWLWLLHCVLPGEEANKIPNPFLVDKAIRFCLYIPIENNP